MAEYQLDFDQVAVAGRSSRHRPTFAAEQLTHCINSAVRTCDLVREVERFHHGQWYIPLVKPEVRAWVKTLVFTVPPKVTVSGMDIECSKELVADPAEVAQWLTHYTSGYFSWGALEAQLHELATGTAYFAYDKRHERVPRLAALRQLAQALGQTDPSTIVTQAKLLQAS